MTQENLQFVSGLISGGLAGSILTVIVQYYRGRLQKMKCEFYEEDILSKIPLTGDVYEPANNLYLKRFRITNSTNRDIERFKIMFQFDPSAKIIAGSTSSKEGINYHKVKTNNRNKNVAEVAVSNFNRKEQIEVTFRIADISNNIYYIKEMECTGFKIKCKDTRSDTHKSRSRQTDTVIVQTELDVN